MSAFFNDNTAWRLRFSSLPANYQMAPPFSVGMCVNLTAVGTVERRLATWECTGSAGNLFAVTMASTEVVQAVVSDGVTTATAGAGTLTAGNWIFVLARFISTVSIRIHSLNFNGSISSGNDATSVDPTAGGTQTMDTLSIGVDTTNNLPWNGQIAEFWYTNTDVQGSDVAINSELLRQLANYGPFSVPNIANGVIEYHSYRVDVPSNASGVSFERTPEVFDKFGGAIWTNNGANVRMHALHPPLMPTYVRPRQNQRTLVI